MWISTFFCSRATDASLEPLENIVHSLQGKTEVRKVIKPGSKSYVKDDEFNSCGDYLDKELNEKKSDHSSHESKTILVRSERSYPIISLNSSIKESELSKKLQDLYKHLYDNKNNYYSGYVSKIAEKSHTMVVKIEAYLKEKKKTGKKIKLAEARTAIDDFHSAFKLSQTRNMILAGLVIAIIGALLIVFAGHFGVPLLVAGFKTKAIGAAISGSGGAGILFAGLRNLFFGSIANLKELADESQAAAEKLLSSITPIPSHAKDKATPFQDKEKDGESMRAYSTEATDVEDEEGFCAWLTGLFKSLNNTHNSFAHRTQLPTHKQCTGEEGFHSPERPQSL